MNYNEKLDKIVSENNGYLTSAMAVASGVNRQSLSAYVKNNNFERVARGIFISESVWPDYYYILFLQNSKIVYSHESALYINKLTEREPSRRTVTVKFGYNAEHLKKQNVAVFTSVDEYFGIGITQNKTAFGNYVPVYDMERSICDIIRNKEKTDIQVFSYALKEYARHKDKNLNNLISYAKLFGIEEEVRSYIEVLL